MIKKYFLILSLFILGTRSFAGIHIPNVKKGSFAFFDGQKYKIFEVFETEELKLSSDCKVKPPKKMSCQAYQAVTGKIKETQSSEEAVSPASVLCTQLGGKNFIAFNEKKEQYNFCRFEDQSLINSWSLFYKRNPK